MKFFLTIAILFATAFAIAPANAKSNKWNNSNNATAVAVSQNKNSVNNSVKVERSVSSAVAPGLAAGGISCAQSGGVGVSTTGFSLSVGGTRQDVECDLRQWTTVNNQLFGANAARRTACKSKYNRDEPFCAGFNGKTAQRPINVVRFNGKRTAAVAGQKRRSTLADYFKQR